MLSVWHLLWRMMPAVVMRIYIRRYYREKIFEALALEDAEEALGGLLVELLELAG